MKGETVRKGWEAEADKVIARWAWERDEAIAAQYGDGLSLRPGRGKNADPERAEWRFSFVDEAGRRRCLTIGLWPECWATDWKGRRKRLPLGAGMTAGEARDLVAGLLAGDPLVIGLVMLQYRRAPHRRLAARADSFFSKALAFAQARGLQTRPAALRAAA